MKVMLHNFSIFLGMLRPGLKKWQPKRNFFSFFGLSRPYLAKNEARMTFFSFLNFFTIFLNFFFGMFYPGLGRNSNRNDFFFFLGPDRPYLAKNEARVTFFIQFFYYFFGECCSPSQVKMVLGTIFFSPSLWACLDVV